MTLLKLRSALGRPPTDHPILVPCQRCGDVSDVLQTCAPCGERLCFTCYAPWTALACGQCRHGSAPLVAPRPAA